MKKVLPFAFMGLSFVFGTYPKLKSEPFDLIHVRFCPYTANTPENIQLLRNRGQKVNNKDFINQEQAQNQIYQEYCRKGSTFLKSFWLSKASRLELSPNSESFLKKEFLNPYRNIDIISYLACIGCASLAFWLQNSIYKQQSKKAFSEIKKAENEVLLTSLAASRAREYQAKQDSQAWDKRELHAGLVNIQALSDRAHRQQIFNHQEFQTNLEALQAIQSQHAKAVAENLRDAAKADKEREKLMGRVKGNESQSIDKKLAGDLESALKNHEGGWLWTIISSIKPTFLFGDAGTGKTNTAVAIALTRKFCLDIPIYRVSDRHYHGENKDLWELIDSQNIDDCDENILAAMLDMMELRIQRINAKVTKPHQWILDEFTQLAKLHKETIERFVPSTFADCRKAREYFLGITHNITNAAFGDGNKDMRMGGFFVKKHTLDGFEPIPRVVILCGLKDNLGNDLENVEKSIPEWFRAETIHAHLTGIKSIEF